MAIVNPKGNSYNLNKRKRDEAYRRALRHIRATIRGSAKAVSAVARQYDRKGNLLQERGNGYTLTRRTKKKNAVARRTW